MTDKDFAAEIIYGIHGRMTPDLRQHAHWTMSEATRDYLAEIFDGGKVKEPTELLGLPIKIHANTTGVHLRSAPDLRTVR